MIDRFEIAEKLKEVNDPELGMNIVDLGLIFNITLSGESVTIQHTLTYPGCPLGPVIVADITKKLEGWERIERVDCKLVWEPAWSTAMIHPELAEELRFMGRIR